MTKFPDSLRELLATGPLATVVTVDPDGGPHATLGWAGFDGDEIVMATFFYLQQRKLQNVRRDPRVTLVLQAKDYTGQGLWPYAVVQGRVDRITEGGALEVWTGWPSTTSVRDSSTRCVTCPTASCGT